MDPHESASHAPVDCPSVGPGSFAAELPYSATTGTLYHDCDVVNDPLHGELSGSLGHVHRATPHISSLSRVFSFFTSLHCTSLHSRAVPCAFLLLLLRLLFYCCTEFSCFTLFCSFTFYLTPLLSTPRRPRNGDDDDRNEEEAPDNATTVDDHDHPERGKNK